MNHPSPLKAAVLTFTCCLASYGTNAWAADLPCFFGEESFTVEFKLTGMETGSITEHVKDCGRKRVEIRDSSMTMSGMTTVQKKRTIYDGDQIITVDSVNGAVTKTTNPMYDQLVESMGSQGGVEFGKQLMQQLGGQDTGKTATYAGTECQIWEIPTLSTTTCVTAWGATLQNSVTMMGMTSDREATKVELGNPGPEQAYTYDAAQAQQQPDVMELLKQLQRK